jgi:hypothetical protein
MRNLKKIVAVIMTVALLASMMVPALAAVQNEDKAQALQAIGLFKGNGSSFDLDLKLIREQGMAIVVRALGAEKDALALSEAEIEAQLAKVADADTIATWARPYAAYMVKNDLTKGIGGAPAGQINYGAQLDLYADEFVILLLRAMGYPNVEKNNVWDLAVEAKLLTAGQAVSLKFNGTIIRDDVVGVLYNAVKSGVCADGNSLIGKLIASGAVDQAVAAAVGFAEAPKPVALAIESATAPNLLQVKVVFNKPVNTDDAKDTSKYQVFDKGDSNSSRAISSAAIDADGKTVTLTLAPTTPLTNNTTAKVTVAKDFREADGTKIPEAISFDKIVVGDTTFPVFERVEAVGAKTLRLYFSEPVTSSAVGSDAFSIKSGSYTWFVSYVKYSYDGKYAEVTVGTNLLDGNIDVKVNSAKVYDFAGLMVFEKTINFAYAKVTSAPQVTIEHAKSYEVKLKFDRPVYGNIKVSFGVKDFPNYTANKLLLESEATDTVTIDFTGKKLPAGTVTLFVFTDDNNPIKDLYGNKFEATSFTVTVNADTTPPAVVSTEVKTNVSFNIKFDEKLNSEVEAEKISNYSLTTADGKPVVFTLDYIDADKTLVVKPTGGFKDNTSYIFTIKSIQDGEGNKNTSEIVLTFSVGDETAPSISEDDSFAILGDGKIYVYYSEAMVESAMLNKVNYMVTTNGSTYFSLGDKDTISKISDKAILIDLDKDLTGASDLKVKVSVVVTDLAGKKLNAYDLSYVSPRITTEQFYIKEAELIAKDKVKIIFNKDVNVFDSAEVVVKADNTTTIAISAVESISGKEVVVKLASEIGSDAKLSGKTVTVSAISGANNTKSPYGTKLQVSAATLTDKVAPSVATVKVDGNDVADVVMSITSTDGVVAKGAEGDVVITFNEDLDEFTISKMTFSVGGYDILSIGESNGVVTIHVKAKDDNTIAKPVVTHEVALKDAEGNVLTAGTSWACR